MTMVTLILFPPPSNVHTPAPFYIPAITTPCTCALAAIPFITSTKNIGMK